VKAVLRGKFIAMSVCIKNSEKSQINDLMVHPKLLETQEQAKPKSSRNEEIFRKWQGWGEGVWWG
jgi:hypothetical protein